jgi:tetratricopeptide (TPR) repeat protein
MKIKHFIFIFSLILFYSCSSTSNNLEFIKKVTGRYLYNSDEVVEVYFKENELFMVWRGAKNIKPLKINDSTFYVKEMNEKIQFLTNPSNQQEYISLVPKKEGQSIAYNYKKLKAGEKIPSEYLKNNEFDKALEGYLTIQKTDSLSAAINEGNLNSFGYTVLRKKKYENAINIFKINIALYPTSPDVYDSLGDAFRKKGDTAQAIVNYKKSLEFDSGNARVKRIIKRLEKKK